MRQARLQDQVEHDVLVAADGRRRASGDDRGDPARAAVAVGAAQDVRELMDVRQALGLRLANDAFRRASESCGAISRIARAGVAQRMPWRRVTSFSSSERAR